MPILTDAMDKEVLRNGWVLAPSIEKLNLDQAAELLLVGAVGWSAWDRKLLQSLADVAIGGRALNVIVFNLDETDSPVLSGLLGERSWSPNQPPLVALLNRGVVQRVEQGWPAVEWVQTLGPGA